MIKKQFLKSKDVCKVTFNLSKQEVGAAKQVNLAGEFNGWDEQTDAFTKMKSGSFKLTLPLEKGREYQFRYLVDGEMWLNDSAADKYVPSGVGEEENCVIAL